MGQIDAHALALTHIRQRLADILTDLARLEQAHAHVETLHRVPLRELAEETVPACRKCRGTVPCGCGTETL